ncbi:PepSY-associated TM helix domain-containing protein [Agarilytica rhodophyticola]|uniref:PepSY-associated TM helix domain-containing protein n=1 Tax=Agarilytica rhodophyticola TaxID=1737490 RepID=UPI000B349AA8|nr:PepSY-associated TM helix domain-containing protein [Agarilytica rhodophyticola]
MKFPFSKNTILKSTYSHSVLGLAIGTFMYLLCLTGTLLVFTEYWERWEQPHIPEFSEYPPSILNVALENFLQKVDEAPETIYLVLPTADLPRIHVAGDINEWWVDQKGNIIEQVEAPWTELVKNIHVYLHLPKTIGILIVSIIGAIFIGLIISGLIAHPSIVKDAFKVRIGGNRRIEMLDIHNRLSVWALPFHLMIGITGAFFGMVGLLVVIAASAFYNGDRQALFDDIYGSDPVIQEAPQELRFDIAHKYIESQYPEASPIYIAIQNYGTEEQYFEFAATFPQTLAYSEIFRFRSSGEFINRQDLIGGSIGRQALYSVYRLHFGHFGNLAVRTLYIILGLALTIISVTGINLWLCKKQENWLHRQWCALVWGIPISLGLAAFASLLALPVIYLFIFSQVICSIYCSFSPHSLAVKKNFLMLILTGILLMVSLIHLILLFSFEFYLSGITINILLMFIALALFLALTYIKSSKGALFKP